MSTSSGTPPEGEGKPQAGLDTVHALHSVGEAFEKAEALKNAPAGKVEVQPPQTTTQTPTSSSENGLPIIMNIVVEGLKVSFDPILIVDPAVEDYSVWITYRGVNEKVFNTIVVQPNGPNRLVVDFGAEVPTKETNGRVLGEGFELDLHIAATSSDPQKMKDSKTTHKFKLSKAGARAIENSRIMERLGEVQRQMAILARNPPNEGNLKKLQELEKRVAELAPLTDRVGKLEKSTDANSNAIVGNNKAIAENTQAITDMWKSVRNEIQAMKNEMLQAFRSSRDTSDTPTPQREPQSSQPTPPAPPSTPQAPFVIQTPPAQVTVTPVLGQQTEGWHGNWTGNIMLVIGFILGLVSLVGLFLFFGSRSANASVLIPTHTQTASANADIAQMSLELNRWHERDLERTREQRDLRMTVEELRNSKTPTIILTNNVYVTNTHVIPDPIAVTKDLEAQITVDLAAAKQERDRRLQERDRLLKAIEQKNYGPTNAPPPSTNTAPPPQASVAPKQPITYVQNVYYTQQAPAYPQPIQTAYAPAYESYATVSAFTGGYSGSGGYCPPPRYQNQPIRAAGEGRCFY